MITDWFLSHATTTMARVMVRTDAAGTLSWSGDGAAADVALDPAVHNGWGYLEITGLEAGRTYQGIATVAGDRITVHPRTMPASGGCIGFTSCQQPQVDWSNGAELILAQGIDAFVFIGDFFYINSNSKVWNNIQTANINSVALATDRANWDNWWRHNLNNPGVLRVSRAVPMYSMVDDHEVGGGDNWDHTVAQANSGESAMGAANQGEVNDAFAASMDAFDAIIQAQPTTSGSLRLPTEVADNIATYPVDEKYYKGRYFNFDVGDLQVIVLDCMSFRDPLTQTDNNSKKMIANAQRNWSADLITNTSKPATVILSPKKFWTNVGESGDAFNLYTTERGVYLDQIDALGKVVLFGTGDRHEISAAIDRTRGQIHINACPFNQKWVPSMNAGYAENVVYKYYGGKALSHVAGGDFDQNRSPGVYGIFRRGTGETGAYLMSSFSPQEYYRVIVGDDGTISYPRPRLAIG